MGQTPPPWHGQAVATQILFEHDWPGFEVHRLRMEFSEEMVEVGRFQWKKIRHLFQLIRRARAVLREHPGCVLFYPPASAKWIPFVRDVIFLACVRPLAGSTVFIFHASGLPVFVESGWIRRRFGRLVYGQAEVALEVAQELVAPHDVFAARSWQWCPCAIEVPAIERPGRPPGSPLTVLFVASLQEGKGVLEVLRTAAVLKAQGRGRDFRFRIVGKWFSSDFELDARHLATELEVDGMIDFVGQLTGDEKWRAYAEADVFFFPTHYESEATPIVLMEALGMGLPLLTTEWAGIPAMLAGCASARLCPIRSPERYAQTLLDFDEERSKAAEFEAISKQFYHQHFLPIRFIERVEKAFLRAAGRENVLEIGGEESALLSPRAPMATSGRAQRSRPAASSLPLITAHCSLGTSISISVYLADQNPGYDRSFGISRMSQVVLEALHATGRVEIEAVSSKTSQQAPAFVARSRILPWGTRRKWIRLLTDHLHPAFGGTGGRPDLYYFPKGYLPWLDGLCQPSVVTIHDTIIQYDEDHYPDWRNAMEYRYWARMLKHTLRNANRILTVSESSRRQIQDFMERHRIPVKDIHVTYEPCMYEGIAQPVSPAKQDYVIHLTSCEPHKRSAHLVRWWSEAERQGHVLPSLHLIGTVPPEVEPLLASARTIVKRPFLEDSALQAAYLGASALILPSEIEGFGLPALEAYYLGTPVCFVKGTSVEEILSVATNRGGFTLDSADSLFGALEEVIAMSADEIRDCGLTLREAYAAEKVAERMMEVFEEVKAERLNG
jgi:glycosyltransferase involved in cell wall biosynthesis